MLVGGYQVIWDWTYKDPRHVGAVELEVWLLWVAVWVAWLDWADGVDVVRVLSLIHI